jgi:phage FluMu gp28-like protein
MHGSEVAFWPDAERIIAGAMQGGSPDVVLESTPNGAQGFFYERCQEALRGDSIWKLHFYPWWWDDNYFLPLDEGEILQYTDDETRLAQKNHLTAEQIKWRRSKQRELKRFFIQEYPEDPQTCFITSGNSYFGDISNNYNAIETPWQEGHRYIAGLDFGQTNDYTALIVIDHSANQMVDFLHINKLEWAEQRRRIVEVCKNWNVQTLVAESNSIGSVNIEALMNNGVNIRPFQTTNASKAEIMSDLYESLHNGLQLQDISVLKHELNTFVSTQTSSGVWRLAAEGDGHDDTVIALALANQNLSTQVFL